MIILRVHQWGVNEIYAFKKYSAIEKTIVCYDLTGENVPPVKNDFLRLDIDRNWLINTGLNISCDKLSWRCGDYSFYRVFDDYPDEEYYWIIEPDVLINFVDPMVFFNEISKFKSDFLGLMYGPRGEDWYWHKMIRQFYPNQSIFGCSFGVVRLSQIAVKELYIKRVAFAKMIGDIPPQFWPNDESFVVNTLLDYKLNLKNFNDVLNNVSSYSTYWINKSKGWHEFDEISSIPDNKIYHPVRGFTLEK